MTMSEKTTVDWNAGRRLDEVKVFDGKLTFLIPNEWVTNEEEDQSADFYSYTSPRLPCSWFRASLITLSDVADPMERLLGLFAGRNHSVEKENGNFVARSEKASSEDGQALRVFYWAVANVVRPSVVREAVFSYTVPAEGVDGREIQREIDLIDKLVRLAQFS